MARKSIQYYVYTPGSSGVGTVKFGDVYQAKDILMITNVTKNVVIYNFSDPTRGGVITANPTDTAAPFNAFNNGTTTVTLTLDTSTHSSTDKLQIFVDTVELRVRTHDFGIDAVERQRVAAPESLIDADFEYGMQLTKWATWTTVHNQPITHEVPGTDVQANLTGYATMMTADSSGNITAVGAGGTSFKLVNQGFIGGQPGYIANTSPVHNTNDYKIVINQPLFNLAPVGTTYIANSAVTAGARYISQSNGGMFQRTFTVGTVSGWNAGDLGVIVGLPASDSAITTTSAVTSGATAMTINSAVVAGATLAVETSTGGVFELVGVNAGGGSATLGITRGLLGTNNNAGTALTIPVGARVKQIIQAANVGWQSNLEIFRVDSVDTTNNNLTITRGWLNTNASPEFLPGSIVAKVNMAAPLSPSLGGSANIEIVRNTTPTVAINGSATVVRAALGTTPISAAPAGSLVITAAGVFMAGNTAVPVIAVNANSHGIASGVQGAGTFGLSASVLGSANAGNIYVSTTGINNPNIEGIFINTINDVHYAAYYPKVWPNRDIGYPFNFPTFGGPTDLVIRKGAAYTSANINYISIVSNTGTPSTMTVTTLQPHGLYPGQLIQTQLYGSTNANTHASGVFAINSVPYSNQFTFVAKTGAAVANAVTTNAQFGTVSQIFGNITMFAPSLVRHRPVDGGTNIGVNAPAFGYDVERQTKKYFRYQSGKGMMFTTGISLSPVFTVINIAAAGTSIGSAITLTTELDHGLQTGANIGIYNIATSGYNGFYRVATVTSQNQLTVLATSVLGATTPVVQGNPKFNVINWHGSKVQIGMHDDQNGVFWEYDGQNVKAGKRSATRDIIGRVSIGQGQQLVTGDSNTRFQDQVLAGDNVIIRGMNHTVSYVESQATMYVTPPFKGAINAVDAKISIVDNFLVNQSDFNRDKLDGTGPSGYVLDKTKMQMIAIQYTWYGAGFIDYGLRTTDGQMIWAHRTKNNNINDEAYMRSGNLPARYRTANQGPYTSLNLPLTIAETGNINLASIVGFPTANVTYPAVVMIEQPASSGLTPELILYTAGPFAANGNICGLTRSYVHSNFNLAQTRSMSMGTQPQGSGVAHAANSSVRLFSVTASADLNHWGSAVILDGGFTKDRSYNFTFNLANTNVLGTTVQTLFMMRLAPTITNAITGDLGVKDVINRAQLQLQNIFVNIANNSATLAPRFLIQAVLNPTNVLAVNWQPLNRRFNTPDTAGTAGAGGYNQPSFTQFCANVYPAGDKPTTMWGVNTIQWDTRAAGQHNGSPYAQGGEQLFSIPVSATNSGFIDLATVKEIGGAVVPGLGFYPNGNEIVAFNIVPAQGSQANVDIQIQYTESQA